MKVSNLKKQLPTGLLNRNLLQADDVGLVGQNKEHEQSTAGFVVTGTCG
jgi:hypothetical protein